MTRPLRPENGPWAGGIATFGWGTIGPFGICGFMTPHFVSDNAWMTLAATRGVGSGLRPVVQSWASWSRILRVRPSRAIAAARRPIAAQERRSGSTVTAQLLRAHWA